MLDMIWDEKLFIDTVLPFGLRSAPKIFTALADALEWILLDQGVTWASITVMISSLWEYQGVPNVVLIYRILSLRIHAADWESF